jgi:hypothetical protein
VSGARTGRAPGPKTATTRRRPCRQTGHRVRSTPVNRCIRAATDSGARGSDGGSGGTRIAPPAASSARRTTCRNSPARDGSPSPSLHSPRTSLTGRRISRRRDSEGTRRSDCRLHPRNGPRERPQHAEVYPPPRCADCVAPALSAANLPCAAGLGDIEPPGVPRLDRRDGRARRRIALPLSRRKRSAAAACWAASD